MPATIYAIELAVARRDVDAVPGGYDAVLDEGFTEFGSSGRVWTREATLEMLGAAPRTDAISIEEFELDEIRPDVFLARYVTVAVRPDDGSTIRSRRSTLWVRSGGMLRMRFHQGTPLRDGEVGQQQ